MNSTKQQVIKLTCKNKLHFYAYMNNEQPEKEIMKTIPLKIASKTVKYVKIHLIRKMNDLYTKNFKILLNNIKKLQINGNMFHVHKLEDNISKMSIQLKTIYRFCLIFIKIPVTYFAEIKKKTHLKIHRDLKGLQIAKRNLKEKNKT